MGAFESKPQQNRDQRQNKIKNMTGDNGEARGAPPQVRPALLEGRIPRGVRRLWELGSGHGDRRHVVSENARLSLSFLLFWCQPFDFLLLFSRDAIKR